MSKNKGFGGLILDKKSKVVSDLSSSMQKSSSAFHQNKGIGVEVSQSDGHSQKANSSINPGPSINSGIHPKKVDCTSPSPSLLANTEHSLSLATKCDVSTSVEEVSNFSYAGIPSDKILENFCPDGAKEEMLLKLVPRVRELQSQMQEWTEWAQQKVMQAARRLSKDKVELERQEKEEVVRLKKEIQTLEENTMKKLSEMENALGKASGQVERANAAVRRLESENAELRQEMEEAKVRAAESAASCQEVSMREKKTEKQFQSWERQKELFQEEHATEKRKLSQLRQQVEQAKDFQAQLEDIWEAVCSFLLHPHLWLQNISNRSVAWYFSAASEAIRVGLIKQGGTLLLLKIIGPLSCNDYAIHLLLPLKYAKVLQGKSSLVSSFEFLILISP